MSLEPSHAAVEEGREPDPPEVGETERLPELMQYLRELEETRAALDRTNRQLQAVVASATETAIFSTDPDGIITLFNPGTEKMLGYTAAEIVGRHRPTLFHLPHELELKAREIEAASGVPCHGMEVLVAQARRNGSDTGEWTVARKDGTRIQIQLTVTVIEERGEPTGYLGIATEITQRKRMEQEIRDSREMLASVIDAIPHPIYVLDPGEHVLKCNRAFESLMGVEKERMIGTRLLRIPTRERSCLAALSDRRLKSEPYSLQETVRRADAKFSAFHFNTTEIRRADGTVKGRVGVILDVTEQQRVEEELHLNAAMLEFEVASHQQMEEALRESEERLRVIFEASPAGIVMIGPDGTVSFANRRMAEMLGCQMDQLIGSSYSHWLHPAELSDGERSTHDIFSGRIEAISRERRYLRVDGTTFWGYLSGKRLEGPDGSTRALVACIADVSELKASQSALECEKERLAVTLRSIGEGVITVDTHERVVLMNRVAESLCGYRQEEACGLPLAEVFRVVGESTRKPLESPVAQVLRSRQAVQQATPRLLTRNGAERIIASTAAPILDKEGAIPGVVLVFRDITDRREIEEELFKARKLESLGILAGGIAHDFNNLLTGIMGNISLAGNLVEPEHPAAPYLERAQKASERSRELTRQLLTFSRGGAPVKKLTSIPQILIDSATFALRGSNVACDFDIAPELHPAEIDAGQMSQVISNLVINADQAMPEGGSIVIRAENELPPAHDTQSRIRITIKDTGTGIPDAVLSRIYDPYFTTKPSGSGLGLATVYAIVKNHGGEIKAYSRVDHGTTFSITLPAVAALPPKKEEPKRVTGPASGRILVMDDEESIREMAESALSLLGYQAGVARDGAEMLELYRQAQNDGSGYRAVIMDLTVPGGMGGKEAVQKLLELDPEAVAIASSGYSEDQTMSRHQEYGFAGTISKPYGLQELEDALRRFVAAGE